MFIAIIIFLHVVVCENPNKVLDMISSSIGRTVLECREEVAFSEDVIDDFLKFWVPGYPLKLEEMGCVVFCVLIKLQLVEERGVLRKDNLIQFGKANGADGEIINGLISVVEECRGSIKFSFSEPCTSGLSLATCFREKVFLLRWAPKPDAHYDDSEY